MPVFSCVICGCMDNTACSEYWSRVEVNKNLATCTKCYTGNWHNRFEKISSKGMLVGEDGFLYSKLDKITHTKIIGEIL